MSLAQAPHPDAVSNPSEAVQTPSAGVLIVDDDQSIGGLLMRFLTLHGVPAWYVQNSREAVKVYRRFQHQIAYVLLDVRLPELDGPHTLLQLQKINAGVCCCYMSGDSRPYTQEQLLQTGAIAVLAKPFPLSSVLAYLDKAEPTKSRLV